MTKSIFEVATRNKFRFPYKGQISVEDLWDLSLPGLDSVFKALNAAAKQAKEESLLATKSREDEILEMKIDIVKYIVTVKQTEAEAKVAAKAKKEKRDKLLNALAKKQDEAIESMTVADIEKMLAELE